MSEQDIEWSESAYPLGNGWVERGMSLRDWFAGQALAGCSLGLSGMDQRTIAKLMYDLADALAERAKS